MRVLVPAVGGSYQLQTVDGNSLAVDVETGSGIAGPTGPTGPAGPTGPTGATGPAAALAGDVVAPAADNRVVQVRGDAVNGRVSQLSRFQSDVGGATEWFNPGPPTSPTNGYQVFCNASGQLEFNTSDKVTNTPLTFAVFDLQHNSPSILPQTPVGPPTFILQSFMQGLGFIVYDVNGTANEKTWVQFGDTLGGLNHYLYNDVGNAASLWMHVTGAPGTTIKSVEFPELVRMNALGGDTVPFAFDDQTYSGTPLAGTQAVDPTKPNITLTGTITGGGTFTLDFGNVVGNWWIDVAQLAPTVGTATLALKNGTDTENITIGNATAKLILVRTRANVVAANPKV